MANWNDQATTHGRVAKGSPLSLEQYDENVDNLNEAQATRAPYALDGSAIIGFTGEFGTTFPVVYRPVEVLASSAISASCASTAIDEDLATFTIFAGSLGINSILQIEPLWTFASSGNNKITKVIIGGVTVYSATRTTSVKEAPLIVLANRGSLGSQIQPYDNNYVTAGSGTPATYTIDFAINNTVQITGQRANSGDALTLEYFRCLHFIGD